MKPFSYSLELRPTKEEDRPFLKRWLLTGPTLAWFPMCDEREVDDAVAVWIQYAKSGMGITAVYDGKPCGIFNLYIQPFGKLKHTCLFSIIVEETFRGKGIGTTLIAEGEKLAKERYGIEILHLEVYEGNPAFNLYKKMGFEEYGRHEHFIKEANSYKAKICMQKVL
jgi:ribosomal protein S18 acetylase RimI-like enzyme